MGRDKATLEVGGEPLARRVARVLSDVAVRIIVASGDGSRLGWLGLEQVADPVANGGPLAGIVAGVRSAATPLVAVAAVDMPFASAAVFRHLAGLWSGEDAVVPMTERGLEPLHAVYATRAGDQLAALFDSGVRSVRDALQSLSVRCVAEGEWRTADPSARFFRNLNVPEDLR